MISSPIPLSIAFRADASGTIGTGHVMRCLTLATEMRTQGATVTFIAREEPGHLNDLLRARGFSVIALPAGGVLDWAVDAGQTRHALEGRGAPCDWLVVDHYALDEKWERALRSWAKRILVVDDRADRPHDCDCLLDQNQVAGMRTRYDGKLPGSCITLLGPEYALLQPEYREWRPRVRARRGPISRVLVYFGGTDPDDLTGRALSALLVASRPGLEVDAVLPRSAPHLDAVRACAATHPGVRLHHDLPSLAPLMAAADLAIGAGGATSWERLCLGLPAMVITIADNQRPIAEELDRLGLVQWLGDAAEVSLAVLTSAVGARLREDLPEECSRRGQSLVDGRGTLRVATVLGISARWPLCVRPVEAADEGLILTWANDPLTRRNAFDSSPISADVHADWFRRRLAETGSFYIVETEAGVPIGQVRFAPAEAAWEIHYAVAPAFRGRGIGRAVLATALDRFRKQVPRGARIFGQVKPANAPSRRIFESLGFEPGMDGEAKMVYRLTFS